jgi:DNA/RNA-binding domain of Phe-tRNA-synthetase-like protein
MRLVIDRTVAEKFPGLHLAGKVIRGLEVSYEKIDTLLRLKEEIYGGVREKYTLESLKDQSLFRAYRDFFWKLGIDPTKIRPASEALVRRILQGKEIPSINPIVDTYNLASIRSGIPMAAFDLDKMQGTPVMKFATKGEEFFGIGMTVPLVLKGHEVVISDEKGLIAIYPYRDSDRTKITENTENILLLVCGVPGVERNILEKAERIATEYIEGICGGRREELIIAE